MSEQNKWDRITPYYLCKFENELYIVNYRHELYHLDYSKPTATRPYKMKAVNSIRSKVMWEFMYNFDKIEKASYQNFNKIEDKLNEIHGFKDEWMTYDLNNLLQFKYTK